MYKATNQTLTSILPPACYQILFNQTDVKNKYISRRGLTGRVIPVGTFQTEVLALEYLYGILCPIPGLPPRRQTLRAFELKRVTYDQKYFITQSEFIFYLNSGKQVTFFTGMAFDKDYKLCGYEGQIRNFGLTFDSNAEEDRRTNISTICAVADRFCNGSLKEYASINDCIQFLTNKVPYGTFDQGDQGSVICRALHTNFVPLLPEIHCPHVGPTGGGKCTDKTFADYYNQPNFLACAYKYN